MNKTEVEFVSIKTPDDVSEAQEEINQKIATRLAGGWTLSNITMPTTFPGVAVATFTLEIADNPNPKIETKSSASPGKATIGCSEENAVYEEKAESEAFDYVEYQEPTRPDIPCSTVEPVSLAFGKTESGDTRCVIKGLAKKANCKYLVIDETTLAGKQFATIGAEAFAGTDIETVYLGKCVTSIEKRAFVYCKSLRKVIIDGPITFLPDGLFDGCSSLGEVYISQDTVKEIGVAAFNDCTSLRHLGNVSNVNKIGAAAFRYCNNISLRFIGVLTSVEEYAFSGTKNVAVYNSKKIPMHTLSKSLCSFSYSTFRGAYEFGQYGVSEAKVEIKDCLNVIRNNGITYHIVLDSSGCQIALAVGTGSDLDLKVPARLGRWEVVLGKNFLGKDSKTVNLTIEEGIRYIPCEFAKGCETLVEVNLPVGIEEIKEEAFAGCVSLETVNLPSSLKKIGNSAFKNCESLKAVSLPDSLLEIEQKAFAKCSSLVQIELPGSLSVIANDAFEDNETLFLWTRERFCRANWRCEEVYSCEFGIIETDDCVVSISDEVAKKGTLERYFLSQLSVKIPSKVEGVSITSIGSGCFYDSQIKSIEIPEGVEKIEESAFCNCKELETVALPTSLAFIGEYAFGDCKKLKRVSFGPNIKKISAHSFQGCSSLDCFSFDANASLQEIGEKAFAGCATTRILLPQVKEIKEGAVECDIVTYSSSETVSSWPSSIQKLCKIKNVSRIIVDNDGFSYVFLRGKEGANLYDYRGSLSGKEIRIPRCVEGSSVTSIVFDAWEKLRDASKIYVPASIKRIEQKRSNLDFNYSLKEIEFEEGSLLETIPDFFADKATHLKKINLSSCNQLKTIGSYAFRFCALENLELPCSLSSLGEGSFESGIKSPTREIVIPRGVESIPPRCFAGCSVSNFSLPESLTEIGDETFKDVKMDSIYIPRNVISVGDGALVGVKNITFGELAKNIRFGRFYKSLFAKAQFGKYE